jgi:hypothetical protein
MKTLILKILTETLFIMVVAAFRKPLVILKSLTLLKNFRIFQHHCWLPEHFTESQAAS